MHNLFAGFLLQLSRITLWCSGNFFRARRVILGEYYREIPQHLLVVTIFYKIILNQTKLSGRKAGGSWGALQKVPQVQQRVFQGLGAPRLDNGEKSFISGSRQLLRKCLEVPKRSLTSSWLSTCIYISKGQAAHWSNNSVPESSPHFAQLSEDQERHSWQSSCLCTSIETSTVQKFSKPHDLSTKQYCFSGFWPTKRYPPSQDPVQGERTNSSSMSEAACFLCQGRRIQANMQQHSSEQTLNHKEIPLHPPKRATGANKRAHGHKSRLWTCRYSVSSSYSSSEPSVSSF